jgi:hypothetical protein
MEDTKRQRGTVQEKTRRATDEQVLAWAARHDLDCWDNLTAARAAFEDAQSLHMDDACARKG